MTAEMSSKTQRRRHDHTVDKRVLLTAGGKHYVNDNGVLQQPAWTKMASALKPSRHQAASPVSITRCLLKVGERNIALLEDTDDVISGSSSGDPVSVGHVTVLHTVLADADDLETWELHAQSTARVLASQAEAIVRTGKHGHKLLNGGQATKRR